MRNSSALRHALHRSPNEMAKSCILPCTTAGGTPSLPGGKKDLARLLPNQSSVLWFRGGSPGPDDNQAANRWPSVLAFRSAVNVAEEKFAGARHPFARVRCLPGV